MTTIIPTVGEPEGDKLLGYEPGTRVTLTFTVDSNDGRRLVGSDEVCTTEEEGGEEYEGEEEAAAPAPAPAKGPAKALLAVSKVPMRR